MVQDPESPTTSSVKLQQLRAVRRVDYLRMKLHAIEAAPIIGDGGKRCPLACRNNPEPGRQ